MTASGQNPALARGSLRSLLLVGAVFYLACVLTIALTRLVVGVPPAQLFSRLAAPGLLWGIAVIIFVPGLLLAERASRFAGRAVPYTVLVLLGTALVAAITIPLGQWLGLRRPPPPGDLQFPPQVMAFLNVVVRAGLCAFIYASHREQLEALQAAQALETRRNEMMGRLTASRLQTARARVQPEAFVVELRGIRATYLEGPAAGSGLDSLITRLRAASRSASP